MKTKFVDPVGKGWELDDLPLLHKGMLVYGEFGTWRVTDVWLSITYELRQTVFLGGPGA